MAGRKKIEGARHSYTVSDDVHEWIMAHGAGQYINDVIRIIKSVQK